MTERRELSSRSLAVHRLGLRRRIGFGIMAASVALFGAVYLPFNQGPSFFLGLLAFLGLPIGAIVATTARRDPGAGDGRPGTLRLDGGRLAAEYARVKYELTAEELDTGWIEEAVRGPSLVLRTKQRDIIEARLDDAAARVAAQGLLRALDLDASAIHMSLGSTAAPGRGCATGCLYAALVVGLPVVVGAVGGAIQVLRGDQGYGGILFFALVATALVAVGAVFSVRALRAAEVTIGSDGLWIRRAPWRKRFVPFRELRLAAQRGDEALIETETDVLTLPCQDGGVVNELVRRVNGAQTRWQDGAGAVDLTELDRRGRPPRQWRDQLLALFEHARDYRSRALQRDDLWQVLEDPQASPERRVGAALALSSQAKSEERRRLRIAAAGCALRPLRLAIEEAAAGELEAEALEEAMTAHRSTNR